MTEMDVRGRPVLYNSNSPGTTAWAFPLLPSIPARFHKGQTVFHAPCVHNRCASMLSRADVRTACGPARVRDSIVEECDHPMETTTTDKPKAIR